MGLEDLSFKTKICIWCSKSEPQVSFIKQAHTFPKSLGGENVCDSCNHFFGSPSNASPAIEVVLKEVLNVSKYSLQLSTNSIKKRFKSEYFDFNLKSGVLKYKQKFKLRYGFQEKFIRKFKQGMFKVFLEERERQCNDALNKTI